nr:MAG TPA: hypothetical protein [Caudoviricetes sp.]DAS05089.1 MAG TPA: hypothetical protein [Caudoviricetes sp.]
MARVSAATGDGAAASLLRFISSKTAMPLRRLCTSSTASFTAQRITCIFRLPESFIFYLTKTAL